MAAFLQLHLYKIHSLLLYVKHEFNKVSSFLFCVIINDEKALRAQEKYDFQLLSHGSCS